MKKMLKETKPLQHYYHSSVSRTFQNHKKAAAPSGHPFYFDAEDAAKSTSKTVSGERKRQKVHHDDTSFMASTQYGSSRTSRGTEAPEGSS
jgi:hypothetical protein